jgi:hypothetical protein
MLKFTCLMNLQTTWVWDKGQRLPKLLIFFFNQTCGELLLSSLPWQLQVIIFTSTYFMCPSCSFLVGNCVQCKWAWKELTTIENRIHAQSCIRHVPFGALQSTYESFLLFVCVHYVILVVDDWMCWITCLTSSLGSMDLEHICYDDLAIFCSYGINIFFISFVPTKNL